jgi:hypothetical protein
MRSYHQHYHYEHNHLHQHKKHYLHELCTSLDTVEMVIVYLTIMDEVRQTLLLG